jgi:hypothetical protein
VERSESCCAGAKHVAESRPKVSGVDVAAGGVVPEDPVAVGVRGRLVVTGVRRQFAPWSVERVRQCDPARTDADGDQVLGDFDVVPGESDDIVDLLPEDEDEDRRGTVPWGELESGL